jgi:hypothetical protein
MTHVDLVTLTFVAGLGSVVALGVLLWASRKLGLAARPRCASCAAYLLEDAKACTVCGVEVAAPAPVEDPWEPGPGPATVSVAHPGHVDPDVGYLNGRMSRRFFRVMLAVMVGGIAVRVLAMLGPVGVDVGVPGTATAILTLVGGLAAFVGFVMLDMA